MIALYLTAWGLLWKFYDRIKRSPAFASMTDELSPVFTARNMDSWAKRANVPFLSVFDRIYFSSNNSNQALYLLFFVMAIFALVVQGMFYGLHETEDLLGVVLLNLFLSYLVIRSRVLPMWIIDGRGANVVSVMLFMTLGVWASMTLIFPGINGTLNTTVTVILYTAIIGMFVLIVRDADFLSFLRREVTWFQIDPFKAALFSVGSVCIVALIAHALGLISLNAIWSTNVPDMSVISFVGFNVLADTVSLAETRWILGRGRDVSTVRLVSLLVLDIFLSAGIFMALPLVLWELPDFIDGITFSGPRPWLGILFWSTFATSAVFYLYVLGILLARIIFAPVRITASKIDYTQDPWFALVLACGMVITVLFIILIFLS